MLDKLFYCNWRLTCISVCICEPYLVELL
uniref:Uncharacterized protein n=1 Tax=Rhizophora mucronata TaxID=61149 RepID=A0A2P2INF3_RHIMU